MKMWKGTKGTILLAVIVIIIVFVFYLLNNRGIGETELDDDLVMSPVQEVLARNMDTNYPATPREVLKYEAQITKCYYNETLSEEDFQLLVQRERMLYDEELLAQNSLEDQVAALVDTTYETKANGYVLSEVQVSSSLDVEEFAKDGYEWASLYVIFTFKKGSLHYLSQHQYIMRKDEQGDWKIYGWQMVVDEES